jgi:hypothetical protein
MFTIVIAVVFIAVFRQGHGHNQKTGGHQIRQKDRVKVKGKAEFFTIARSEHCVHKAIRIVTGLNKNMPRLRIPEIRRFHK